MKRTLLCALLTAVMLVTLAIGASAVGEEMTVAYGTATIDGTIDDVWANADRQQLKYCKAGDLKVDVNTLPEDCTVYASMLYDNTALYFLFEIEDNEFGFNSSVGDWKNDSIYLYIDEEGSGDTPYNEQQAQLALARVGELEVVHAHDAHAARVDNLLVEQVARNKDLRGLQIRKAQIGRAHFERDLVLVEAVDVLAPTDHERRLAGAHEGQRGHARKDFARGDTKVRDRAERFSLYVID